jgi:hypothetical protein
MRGSGADNGGAILTRAVISSGMPVVGRWARLSNGMEVPNVVSTAEIIARSFGSALRCSSVNGMVATLVGDKAAHMGMLQ